jgi:transcriptional regulator with XRE-family HTH domain
MELIQYVGQRIRELRTGFANGQGLSQEALAENIKASTNTISRWETGTYKPSLDDLDKLSRFFGVSVLEFFPKEETSQDVQVAALLRAAKDLPKSDIEELRKYAEFRRARSIYGEGGKPQPGRRRSEAKKGDEGPL